MLTALPDYSTLNLGINHKISKNNPNYFKILKHTHRYFITHRGNHVNEKYLRLECNKKTSKIVDVAEAHPRGDLHLNAHIKRENGRKLMS